MPDAKSAPASAELDLLGDPMRPIRDPRGRPAYAKTKENQLLVITLKGAGWKQADIAEYMGCDPQTLRKHFSRELDHGGVLLDGMAMQVIVKRMLEGSLAAARQVREITRARPPTAEKPAPKLGKKAAADRDAQRPPADVADLVLRTEQLN